MCLFSYQICFYFSIEKFPHHSTGFFLGSVKLWTFRPLMKMSLGRRNRGPYKISPSIETWFSTIALLQFHFISEETCSSFLPHTWCDALVSSQPGGAVAPPSSPGAWLGSRGHAYFPYIMELLLLRQLFAFYSCYTGRLFSCWVSFSLCL